MKRIYQGKKPSRSSCSFQLQVPGWELGLMWGTGLSDVTRSPGAPTPPLKALPLTQLSEDVITLLTNFAKSG